MVKTPTGNTEELLSCVKITHENNYENIILCPICGAYDENIFGYSPVNIKCAQTQATFKVEVKTAIFPLHLFNFLLIPLLHRNITELFFGPSVFFFFFEFYFIHVLGKAPLTHHRIIAVVFCRNVRSQLQ